MAAVNAPIARISITIILDVMNVGLGMGITGGAPIVDQSSIYHSIIVP